jgi:hypothetical protein
LLSQSNTIFVGFKAFFFPNYLLLGFHEESNNSLQHNN